MASVYLNRHGKLTIHFKWNGQRYTEGTGLPDTPENRKRVDKHAQLIQAEIDLGIFDYLRHFPNGNKAKLFAEKNRTITFKDLAQEWLELADFRTSTRKDYESALNKYLLHAFGTWMVSDITPDAIKRLRKSIKVTNTRINNIMKPLRGILNSAVEKKLIPVNPMSQVTSLPSERVDIDPFSIEEIKLLVDTLPLFWRCYFKFAFFSGLRTSELNALEWKHIDLAFDLITVRQSWVMNEIQPCKTASSRRDVLLLPAAKEALMEMAENYMLGVRKPSKLIFPSTTGTPLSQNNIINRIWDPTLTRLGLRRRTPYQTRHTFASLCLLAGEDPAWVAKQMGHTTLKMIYERYGKYIKNRTRQDGSALSNMVSDSLRIEA
jgi:integrase